MDLVRQQTSEGSAPVVVSAPVVLGLRSIGVIGFVPSDIVSQLRAVGQGDCPYCLVFPLIPCSVHAWVEDVDAARSEAADSQTGPQ